MRQEADGVTDDEGLSQDLDCDYRFDYDYDCSRSMMIDCCSDGYISCSILHSHGKVEKHESCRPSAYKPLISGKTEYDFPNDYGAGYQLVDLDLKSRSVSDVWKIHPK